MNPISLPTDATMGCVCRENSIGCFPESIISIENYAIIDHVFRKAILYPKLVSCSTCVMTISNHRQWFTSVPLYLALCCAPMPLPKKDHVCWRLSNHMYLEEFFHFFGISLGVLLHSWVTINAMLSPRLFALSCQMSWGSKSLSSPSCLFILFHKYHVIPKCSLSSTHRTWLLVAMSSFL